MDEFEQLYNRMNAIERIVLYSIGSQKNTPVSGKTKLQKLIFLVRNVFSELEQLISFEPLYNGPYSEEVDNVLEDLIALDLVLRKQDQIKLSEKGEKLFKKLKPDENLRNVIDDFKEFSSDIPNDYMLAFVYISYPKSTIESNILQRIMKKRVEAAIYMLREEKVSFSKAAEIAGLSISNFEDELNKRKVYWRIEH